MDNPVIMDNPAVFLLQQFRNEIDIGATDYEAYNHVTETYLDFMQRSKIQLGRLEFDHIEISDLFLYRYELMLVGLHTDHVRGICLGHGNGIQVATCVAAKYLFTI